MDTQCSAEQMEFHGLGRRRVAGRFDGGRMSSDGGGVLLREADLRLGLTQRLAGCFTDYRNAGGAEHSVRELLAQRIYAIALGYEDLNDHDVLVINSAGNYGGKRTGFLQSPSFQGALSQHETALWLVVGGYVGEGEVAKVWLTRARRSQ